MRTETKNRLFLINTAQQQKINISDVLHFRLNLKTSMVPTETRMPMLTETPFSTN